MTTELLELLSKQDIATLIVSPTLLALFLIWLFQNLILTRLKASVKHEFDGKLKILESDLKAKESQIESLRSGALSNLAQRQLLLFERKIKATESLWKAVGSLSYIKGASHFMQKIDFEKASKALSEDSKIQELFKLMPVPTTENITKNNIINANECRPFVSPMLWAYYSAYSAIIWDAYLRVLALRHGVGNAELIKTDSTIKLVEVALPHHTDGVNKYGISYTYLLLEELEGNILQEIKRMLSNEDDDQDMINKAAKITKAADELMSKNKEEEKSILQ